MADGKHLSVGGGVFRVQGLTYGSFLPRTDGARFPEPDQLHRDLAQIAGFGCNTIRVYDAPPIDLLEAAAAHGVRVIAGFDFRDWRFEPVPGRRANRRVLDAGRRAVDALLATAANRPEVLAVSVGNEVPGDIVRLHGTGAVSDTLSELVREVRSGDPQVLVTYTNYPTTEYLRPEGLTLATFNVFLEDRASFRRYVRHLQVVSGSLPLVITELGLASEVHGESDQARSLDWQLREIDEAGCAGATVYAFTDEWGVGGEAVEGWGFGVVSAARAAKPAASVLKAWATSSLGGRRTQWPSLSVVVCAYNEERTLEQCLDSLAKCDYPDLEVIVCDDGSTDDTLTIARRYPFRVLELPHGGLSRARNAGIEAAGGEVVAFLDADAACHPHWPRHLAAAFDEPQVVAAGGPNLPFADAPFVERAVALSPGAPIEVLLADDRAEHVPGCNMAFRRDVIRQIGGFDPIYTSAGDDVDVCWKLLDAGGEIAFAPAAQVLHHRRATVKGYLRQQRGYGRAERLLLPAHRHRFNRLGQARWSGVIYGGARILPALLRPVVYHGYQGHAPFQRVESRPAEATVGRIGALLPSALPVVAASIVAGFALTPWAFAVTAATLVAVLAYGAFVAASLEVPREEPRPVRLRAVVGLLHLAQPFVRTWGRVRAPRRAMHQTVAPPWWGDRARGLRDLERLLRAEGLIVRIGGPRDRWDIEARGRFHRTRITTAVVWAWQPQSRVQTRPRIGRLAVGLGVVAVAGATSSAPAGALLGGALVALTLADLGHPRRQVRRTLARLHAPAVDTGAET